MNLAEAQDEMMRLSKLIDAGVEMIRSQARETADRENAYRKARAVAWVECPRDTGKEREWTAGRREAWVDANTADLRRDRDIAEGMRSAALEAVRARRAQLSAWQTLVTAHKTEAEFARTGPA